MKAMFALKIVALTALLLSPTYAGQPKKGTMAISYAPDSALVINEAETQLFRAPLCQGQFLHNWSFQVKVYLMNVGWDAAKVGDDSWLRIKVSNTKDMTKIVRDNKRDAGLADPQPFTSPFTYNTATWGTDDIYVSITASQGNPTYQYGLEIVASQPTLNSQIPDGMDGVGAVTESVSEIREMETLEQVAIPLTDKLTAGETGQYEIPFCFEDGYDQRSLTVTTLVPESLNLAPGGVASFLCTSGMMRHGRCYRSLPIKRGEHFFDPSGAIVNVVTPTIPKAEYGPVHLLVLAQGNYREEIEFTITTKLRNPSTSNLQLTGNSEKDLHSVLSYLKSSYESKPSPLEELDEPEELKEEL